jgi:carbamoyl-phosphate synthase large subunit
VKKEKVNVLVIGIGAGSHGEQIIKALRLATKVDVTIIGTDVTDLSTGKQLVDIFYEVPYTGSEGFKNIFIEIIKKHNVRFVFHGSEVTLKFLSDNRDILENLNVAHPLNSEEIINLCMNKYNTFKTLENLGFKVPRYKKINSLEDLKDIDFFPVVLKPNTRSGGSVHVNICFDKEDLELVAKYLLKYGIDLLAQEYIDSDDEYTIGVTSDDNGQIIGSICVRRIINNALTVKLKVQKDGKIYLISTGVSQGQVIKDRNILSQAEMIAKKLGSVGPLNIQCRVINHEIYPFEINPRLSGSTSLRAIAGYNEPEAMILYKVFKQRVNLNDYKEMVILRTIEEVVL